MTWNAAAHSAWEDRQLDEYLDGPEEYEPECPVIVICAKGDGLLYRDRETGRFIPASEAVDLMEEAQYKGSELDDAISIAEEQAKVRKFRKWHAAFVAQNKRNPTYEEGKEGWK